MTIECIAIVGAIATVFAGFGGAALGAYFAHKTGIKLIQTTHNNDIDLMQRHGFNKAAADFRNAFLPEISYLEYDIPLKKTGSTDQSIKWFLRTGLSRHTEALCVFKVYLSNDERIRIDKAWNKYRTQSDNYDSTPMPDKEKKAVLQEIHNILYEFASFK
ncbi:MAG: hypothetical protein JRE64_16225 [Deltaproteobacteria bacterium]|nr:hypothetical protein [Deltaproteobacteria bacterium]